ncbi:MAG: hypothetical protein HUU16_03685 [Candidatus Omnitrophica bacterium]|nr:hypothetical protein [Candidatus Omnitrophota bacterium]
MLSAETRHFLGGVLMWGGLGISVLGVAFASSLSPLSSLATLGTGIGVCVVGGILKKRYCPRCRAGACTLPDSENAPDRGGSQAGE